MDSHISDNLDFQHIVNTIAEIKLHIHWQGKLLPSPANEQYNDFSCKEKPGFKNSCEIEIQLIADQDPPPTKRTLFTTGGPWTLFEGEGCYIVRWGPTDQKTNWEWSVVTSLDFTTIKIYYSSEHYGSHADEKISPLTLCHYPVDQFLLNSLRKCS